MRRQCRISDVTQKYVETFYCILDGMIQEMTDAELTDSISRNFIVQMIPHHMAAIEMSQNLLKYTTNIPLQDIAQGIISEQSESIENMKKIKCCCSKLVNSEQELCQYGLKNKRIMHVMFTDMKNASVHNQINTNFILEMIPHHRGAIEMAENALRYDICRELNPILQAIIASQRRGIMQMQKLLRCMKNN